MTKPQSRSKQTGRNVAIAAALLLLVGGGAAWFFRGSELVSGLWTDPAVAALEAQRAVVFSGDATEEQRQAFRQQMDQLTEEQRRQFFERGRPDMQRRVAESMNELFSKPPAELRKEAKKRAAEIIAQRKEPETDDRGPGGPPWARGNMSEAQRDQMRKQMLDFFPPTTRGQFSEFRRMVNQELKAQGQDEVAGREMRSLFRGPGGPPGRS